MSNIYNVFNTNSENEFSNFLNKLDLNVNELLNLTYIAENSNMPLDSKRNKILELMAGSSTNNYNLCVEQFNKVKKERVLKENNNLTQQLNLNQIMELNELVVNVAKKLKAPNCMQGIFNIIKTKANANVANTFLGMVQQSSVNDSNLKFNTDLQVNGQNLAQIIYNLKNDIEMFINSVECPKEEKKEDSNKKKSDANLNEEKVRKVIPIEQTISSMKNWIQSVRKPESLKTLIQMIDEYMAVAKNNIQINTLAHLKSVAQTKLNKMENINPKIEECLAQQVVSDVCGEDTFNGLLNSLKPTMISITVNKETGECEETCPDCQPVVAAPNMDLVNGVQSVQPLTLSPTAIDAPILKKPDQASVVAAVSALSSHLTDIKSDSRENNIECLQTINTLLGQISTYFNELLSESVDDYSKETFKNYCKQVKTINDLVNIVDSMPNLLGYKKVFHEKLASYVSHLVNSDGWEQQSNTMLATIIDKNVYNYGGVYLDKRMKFISEELDILSIIDSQLIFNAVKKYINDKEIPNDYWDGEDDEELNETFGDGMADPNEESEEEVDNSPLTTGELNYLRRQLPQLNLVKEIYKRNMLTLEGLNDETYNILIKTIDDGFDLLLDKPYLDIPHLVMPSGRIFNLEDYLENFDEELQAMEAPQPEEYWDGEDEEELNEDTVYNHSWYEVEGQKYPKRTKEGVIVDETCSAGATCAANVSGFAKPLGSKPKKRKKPSIDVEMFKESVMNDIPCAIMIENRKNISNVKYKMVDGKGYLYVNEGLVKANTKQSILEAIDDIYNDCLELPVLENFTPYQLEILMEDDMISNTVITPQEKQKQEQELDNEIKANPQLKVGLTDDTSTSVNANQELVGVDDSDIQNKKYIVKDPITGKIKVANSSQIKVMEKQ